MTTLKDNAGTTLVALAYDSAGNRDSATYANGAVTRYDFDALHRLTSLTHDFAGTAQDVNFTYTYNPASQIAERGITNDLYAFARTASTSNLVSDGPSTFVYDVENRLVSASGGRTASLAYDPLGRLWQVSGAAGTARFLYDGDELVAEYDAAGTMLRRYVHGAGADDPIVWYEGASGTDRRSLIANHQGSIVAVADSAGYPIATNSYDPWGVPGANNAGRFQYTGQAWLPELGMYHYKARIYWPALGRFLQTDPVGYKGEMNLYAYVGNDPLNRSDPSGMVVVPEDKHERKTLERLINLRAAGIYKFDKKSGELRRIGDSNKVRSSYLAQRIDRAISSSTKVHLDVASTAKVGGTTYSLADSGEGLTYQDENGDVHSVISGKDNTHLLNVNGKPLPDKPQDILAHEIAGHAAPLIGMSDTGNAVADENKIRSELGLGLRMAEPGHSEVPQ